MTPSGPPRAIPSGRLELFHQAASSYSAAREPLRFRIPIGAPRRYNEHSPPDSDNSVRAFIPTPAAAPAEAPAAAYIDGARSATPTRRVYLDGGGGADVPPGEQGLGKPPEALAQDPTGAEGAGGAGGDRARRQLGRRGARGKLWLWVVGAPPEETALMAGPANVSSAPVTSTMAAAPTTSAAAGLDDRRRADPPVLHGRPEDHAGRARGRLPVLLLLLGGGGPNGPDGADGRSICSGGGGGGDGEGGAHDLAGGAPWPRVVGGGDGRPAAAGVTGAEREQPGVAFPVRGALWINEWWVKVRPAAGANHAAGRRKIKCTQLKMEQLLRNASCVVD